MGTREDSRSVQRTPDDVFMRERVLQNHIFAPLGRAESSTHWRETEKKPRAEGRGRGGTKEGKGGGGGNKWLTAPENATQSS